MTSDLITNPIRSTDDHEVHFSGQIVTTTAGAVLSVSPARISGTPTITKVGSTSGRYKIKAFKPFKRYKHVSGSCVVTSTAPANTTGESGSVKFHTDQIAVDGSIMLQCSRSSDNADADVTSGTVITYHIILSD